MHTRIAFLVAASWIASGCSISDEAPTIKPAAYPSPPATEKNVLHLNFDPSDKSWKPGRWERKDGELICRGYLVSAESEDYCAAAVPNDWMPFSFDGKTYFVLPLAGG